jgi:flagellar basal body-associated protein FliL
MANDYYDFNPSATIWVLLLSGMILFVLAISILLIVMVDRGQATGSVSRSEAGESAEQLAGRLAAQPVAGVRELHTPTARASGTHRRSAVAEAVH